jgi:hypothetical protein
VVGAFQVLISRLEESGALRPGQFPAALVYMEMVKSSKANVSLKVSSSELEYEC